MSSDFHTTLAGLVEHYLSLHLHSNALFLAERVWPPDSLSRTAGACNVARFPAIVLCAASCSRPRRQRFTATCSLAV